MAKYANIIIDISHEKLDRTFQYKIPEELMQTLEVGMQVFVPFGKGARTIKGYVVELTDRAEYDVSKLKNIVNICENSVPIESHLIVLAAWIKKNYGGTMNQALKTVIPIKQKTVMKEKRTVCLNLSTEEVKEKLAQFQQKHNVARARLLEALLRDGEIPY